MEKIITIWTKSNVPNLELEDYLKRKLNLEIISIKVKDLMERIEK